jgi:hypothetical protein
MYMFSCRVCKRVCVRDIIISDVRLEAEVSPQCSKSAAWTRRFDALPQSRCNGLDLASYSLQLEASESLSYVKISGLSFILLYQTRGVSDRQNKTMSPCVAYMIIIYMIFWLSCLGLELSDSAPPRPQTTCVCLCLASP